MKSIIGTLIYFFAACATAQVPSLAIVSLGNSITLHAPNAAIGWTGKWGMGASTAANDYSARLADLISQSSSRKIVLSRFNISNFEKDPDVPPPASAISAALAADIVIVELGDNVQPAMQEKFSRRYIDLLQQVRSQTNVLVCTSTYWPRPAPSHLNKAACEEVGGIYVDIGGIHSGPGNDASYLSGATDGVKSHPGDLGMKKIAEAIHAQLLQSAAYQRLSDQWKRLPKTGP